MATPLTKTKLDEAAANGCEVCEDHAAHTLVLRAGCHPRHGTSFTYTLGSGVVRVGCHACGQLICELKIAND